MSPRNTAIANMQDSNSGHHLLNVDKLCVLIDVFVCVARTVSHSGSGSKSVDEWTSACFACSRMSEEELDG